MNIMIDILKKAGIIALEEQHKLQINTKSDHSLVTNGDLKVSEFLEKELKMAFPEFEIFSEENCYNLPQGNKVIVIDPIDGTQSYSQCQDTWCILVGFIENNIITKGYVYQPSKDLIYMAEKNLGAWLIHNNLKKPIKAINQNPITALLSPNGLKEINYVQQDLQCSNIEYVYGAGLKIAMIAEGKGDIYPNFQHKCSLWDIVAPMIILQEAGGDIIFRTTFQINYKSPLVNIDFCAVGFNLINIKL